MSFQLNQKIKGLTPYEPISGNYRIRLDANESFLAPTEELMKEINEAVSGVRFNRYPDPCASELCNAFAGYYGIDSRFVTAGNGSDELISVITNAFLQKGDKVMCFTPDFSMYKFYAYISECECIEVPKSESFEIDIDGAIQRAKKENIRMIIFSNPCNPTSKVVCSSEVERLISSVDSLVVLDEAYMDFSDQSLITSVDKYDNLIILRTCSKAAGMAAIRLGFAVANEILTSAISSVKSPYNVNSLSQEIGRCLFSDPQRFRYSVERINSSRDMLADEFNALCKKIPDKIKIFGCAANFVYMRVESAEELYKHLLDNGIVVRRFGDYLRITAGRNHENSEVVQAVAEFYSM
ncbi:MAG: histidinol-phosphate transaminase [Clostridiales bacterium]|nr:histidinol-phosphate transaminase [Clostridiales bacterium]